MVHRFHDGAAVTAAYIPDHAIDIEQQNGAGNQEDHPNRLVG